MEKGLRNCRGSRVQLDGLDAELSLVDSIVKDDVTTNQRETGSRRGEQGLVYGIEDSPPVHMAFIFGLQQVFLSISSTVSIPLIVARYICADHLEQVRAELLGTFLFMCGICTFLQCTLGVRLPIIQGGCHKFIPATAALMSLEQWTCPRRGSLHADEESEVWKSRLREIQGSIMLASLTQVVIGCTGLLGFIVRFIGPLTIAPTISLVGLSLFTVATDYCEEQWGIAALTVCSVLFFSLYVSDVKVPLPGFSVKEKCHVIRYPIFKLIPVILSIAIAWSLCAILTAANVFPDNDRNQTSGYYARTDARLDALNNTGWFFFPYPGQWGIPTVSVSGYVAMMAATFTSIIESVGDYYACAKICQVPPPPPHAVNRGIAVEGIGSILSGAFGSGGATTSYSQNIGAIGFTKVGSRRAFQFSALIFVVCGCIGKFGAVLTMLPEPVLGGVIVISFGMVSAVGVSTLQYLHLSSSRNQCILGLSLMLGMMLPNWLSAHPGIIKTGNAELDNALTVLLSTSMFVGGFVGCLLDNTVPGSDEERGILKWRQQVVEGDEEVTTPPDKDPDHHIYELPHIMKFLRGWKICRHIPFSPTFHQTNRSSCGASCRSCRRSRVMGDSEDGSKTPELDVNGDFTPIAPNVLNHGNHAERQETGF